MTDIDESLFSGLGLSVKRHSQKENKWKFLFHSYPKVGKTWLASTAEHDERLAPAIFINREGGVKGIDLLPDPKPYTVDCENLKDVERVFWWLADMERKGTNPFKTVIYDTYSEAHEAQIIEETVKRTKKNAFDASEFTSQNEYKIANSLSRVTVKQLRDLDMHVIVTCHSRIHETKIGDKVIKTKIGLGVSDKAQDPPERLYDCIGYLELIPFTEKDAKGEEIMVERRVLHTKPSSKYLAGARGAAANIGDLIEPTMTDILDRIEGKE